MGVYKLTFEVRAKDFSALDEYANDYFARIQKELLLATNKDDLDIPGFLKSKFPIKLEAPDVQGNAELQYYELRKTEWDGKGDPF